MAKTARYLVQRQKYPASFVYNELFRDFISNNLKSLLDDSDSCLLDIYDVRKAVSELETTVFPSPEKPLHKFSNMIMLHRQMLQYGID